MCSTSVSWQYRSYCSWCSLTLASITSLGQHSRLATLHPHSSRPLPLASTQNIRHPSSVRSPTLSRHCRSCAAQTPLCKLTLSPPHAQVAYILEQYVDELDTRTTALYHGYEAATAQPNHRYGSKDNKESYRLYLVEKSVEAIYEEHAGGLHNHLSDKVSGYWRCFHSFHYLFSVLHLSASTCVSHQGRTNHDG